MQGIERVCYEIGKSSIKNYKVKISESKIQSGIVKYIRLLYPKSIVFSVPNGGKRNIITAANLKREGSLSGVSDLIWMHNGRVFFLEVKTPKGSQSESQKDFEKEIKKQGHKYQILTSTKDFDSFIKENRL